ncbi:MAG TPA: hypothetical protein VNA25_15000 [Phycisphaerae bacterium]|nr:hypothetical protein [Phycisphaerae bacterium]
MKTIANALAAKAPPIADRWQLTTQEQGAPVDQPVAADISRSRNAAS